MDIHSKGLDLIRNDIYKPDTDGIIVPPKRIPDHFDSYKGVMHLSDEDVVRVKSNMEVQIELEHNNESDKLRITR